MLLGDTYAVVLQQLLKARSRHLRSWNTIFSGERHQSMLEVVTAVVAMFIRAVSFLYDVAIEYWK